MAPSRPSGAGRVNVFEVDERYLFKHYFEGDDVFDYLKPYYNNQQYRFEVPPEEFESLQSFLGTCGYDLVVVDTIEAFVVAVEKYTAHPENIFKSSVIQRSVDGYNCFLLTDRAAVERATRDHAVAITDTDLEAPF